MSTSCCLRGSEKPRPAPGLPSATHALTLGKVEGGCPRRSAESSLPAGEGQACLCGEFSGVFELSSSFHEEAVEIH